MFPIIESLIVYSCANGLSGCKEATTAYYRQNEEVRHSIQTIETYGRQLLSDKEIVVYIATPIYSYVTGQTINILSYKGMILKYEPKKEQIFLNWNY